MTEQITELKQRLVVSRKRDGQCCYDPQAKRELIEACFFTRRFGGEAGAGARHQRQPPAHLDDQTSASIAGGWFPATISSNASAVYPGGAGQPPWFADHVTRAGGPVAQWR